MSLTPAQITTLQTELQNDPAALGYAPYITTTDVDSLIAILTFIRDGATPCPTNAVVGAAITKLANNGNILNNAVTTQQILGAIVPGDVASAHEVPVALAEFLRVLKPGGGFLTHMPDLQQACAAVADGRPEQALYQSGMGPVTAMDMIFGMRTLTAQDPLMQHRTGFTKGTLAVIMGAAGFVAVETWVDGLDLWGVGYKGEADG